MRKHEEWWKIYDKTFPKFTRKPTKLVSDWTYVEKRAFFNKAYEAGIRRNYWQAVIPGGKHSRYSSNALYGTSMVLKPMAFSTLLFILENVNASIHIFNADGGKSTMYARDLFAGDFRDTQRVNLEHAVAHDHVIVLTNISKRRFD